MWEITVNPGTFRDRKTIAKAVQVLDVTVKMAVSPDKTVKPAVSPRAEEAAVLALAANISNLRCIFSL